jgi:hypothetical protein
VRAFGGRSTISVVIVDRSVQSRWKIPAGQKARCPAASGAVTDPTVVKPSPSRQATIADSRCGCSPAALGAYIRSVPE